MNCHLCFLAIITTFSARLWNPSVAYSGESYVEVVDGKCVFQNRTLDHHENIQFESPCQAWFCNTETHKVYIGGCTPNPQIEGCTEVRGNGTYPDCCPRLVCDGPGFN
ncbi:complement inhibitor CirpT4-like [Dermacentor variabilis]|uniref:complement inhibitor CirpT4-like n=1 Tax=Dermacentor variabilis TaxID=34621 RepID=UPI003F5C4C5E